MSRLGIIALVIFLAIPILLMGADKPQLLAYNLAVSIEPEAGSIAVHASVDVPLDNPAASTFKFNLHETLVIKKLLVNGKDASFTYAAFEGLMPLPASRGVVVTLPGSLAQSRVHMEIEYSGPMKIMPEFGTSDDWRHSMDDQINSHMVELAGYSSWYPQFVFGKQLQVELAVSLPQNWKPICSGKEIEKHVKDGHELTRWSSPKDMDIVILASPEYKQKSIREAGVNIDIFHTRMPEPFIGQEGAQIGGALKLFSAQLGETNVPGGTVNHVYSPKRKGQGKAGFARPGLIVTSEGLTLEALAQDPKFSLFQGIAHEIAHYWWNFGAEQGDWINEAFAEYYSAIAVQKLSSEEQFVSVMSDYRKQAGELPPDAPSLATVPVMEQTSFVVRYYKGALMLNAFRKAMGDEKFFQASREFFQTNTGKPTGTTEFRNFWKTKLGDKKDMVDVWLDSRGGVPNVEEKKAGS